jgi:WS/DGAT/MGAT family acyltransferase
MASPQRFSALETTFMGLETKQVKFVVGSVLHFDRPLELETMRTYLDAALDEVPRYRQRIARIPVVGHPVWVDDEHFALARHLRSVVVRAPGGAAELDDLTAKLLEHGVPADGPPWRLWIVEGLAGGRGAVVALFHHALLDGSSGVRLLAHMLRIAPDRRIPPRHPIAIERERTPNLLLGELRHRIAEARRFASHLPGRRTLVALGHLIAQGMRPGSALGLNPGHNSAGHAFVSFETDLAEVKAIKQAFGVTINDVVLAVVAGALRRFVTRHGGDPDALHDVRAMIPVGRHGDDDRGLSGNRLAMMLARIPVDAADPAAQVAQVALETRTLKGGDVALAGDLFVDLADLTSSVVLTSLLRVALWRRAFNLIVTNVAGPPVPLFLLDAKLERLVPIVNLWPHQGLGIALASYAGRLQWGLHADALAVPELGALAGELTASFGALAAAARPTPAVRLPA